MKIIIDRKMLQNFRKLCLKAYPNEILASIRGLRLAGGIEITAIEIIPCEGTVSMAKYDPKDISRAKIRAIRKDSDWLGTIHSHCNSDEMDCCGHPSDHDNKSALELGETVMGIVYVHQTPDARGLRTAINWYVPVIPPTIEYKGENK